MTVMEEVLLEEYMRALRIERLLYSEIAELPKGSIQKKKIKGREYFVSVKPCAPMQTSKNMRECS